VALSLVLLGSITIQLESGCTLEERANRHLWTNRSFFRDLVTRLVFE